MCSSVNFLSVMPHVVYQIHAWLQPRPPFLFPDGLIMPTLSHTSPSMRLAHLQYAQNSLARVVTCNTADITILSAIIQQLHCLHVQLHIKFKVAYVACKVLHNCIWSYLAEILNPKFLLIHCNHHLPPIYMFLTPTCHLVLAYFILQQQTSGTLSHLNHKFITKTIKTQLYQSAFNNGWCYFPSVRTEIKCNNSLFSIRMDGNLYAYIHYFPSVWTENSASLQLISIRTERNQV